MGYQGEDDGRLPGDRAGTQTPDGPLPVDDRQVATDGYRNPPETGATPHRRIGLGETATSAASRHDVQQGDSFGPRARPRDREAGPVSPRTVRDSRGPGPALAADAADPAAGRGGEGSLLGPRGGRDAPPGASLGPRGRRQARQFPAAPTGPNLAQEPWPSGTTARGSAPPPHGARAAGPATATATANGSVTPGAAAPPAGSSARYGGEATAGPHTGAAAASAGRGHGAGTMPGSAIGAGARPGSPTGYGAADIPADSRAGLAPRQAMAGAEGGYGPGTAAPGTDSRRRVGEGAAKPLGPAGPGGRRPPPGRQSVPGQQPAPGHRARPAPIASDAGSAVPQPLPTRGAGQGRRPHPARRGPIRGFPPVPGQPEPVYPPGQFSAWNRPSVRAAWLGISRIGDGHGEPEAEPGYSLLAISGTRRARRAGRRPGPRRRSAG